MKRSVYEMPLRTNNTNEVLWIIENKMSAAGFAKKMINGEIVWSKGDGVIMQTQCIGIYFTNGSIMFQGWTIDFILGEADLDGYVGCVIKKKMKRLIQDIMNEIAARGL